MTKDQVYTEETLRKKGVKPSKANKALQEKDRETVREISKDMSRAMNIW